MSLKVRVYKKLIHQFVSGDPVFRRTTHKSCVLWLDIFNVLGFVCFSFLPMCMGILTGHMYTTQAEVKGRCEVVNMVVRIKPGSSGKATNAIKHLWTISPSHSVLVLLDLSIRYRKPTKIGRSRFSLGDLSEVHSVALFRMDAVHCTPGEYP